jgi:hypothetical protein
VLSAAMADIDPIGAALAGKQGVSILGLMGARWRHGLARYEDLHETARLRWLGNSAYRPQPLERFARDISASLGPSARAA